MAEEIQHPHDLMVRAVLSDLAEAQSFLQAHLPQNIVQGLNWSTLKLHEGSFVDDDLRSSEADLLYEVERISGDESIWPYILLEHQSTPDRWMRFRLLKYCRRIWDMSFRETPEQRELRPIAPLVFYQGERGWTHSTEFADLFAESVRHWPWIPHFTHGLIDQSSMEPDEAQGEVKARMMQLLLLAAYHPAVAWMEPVARLLRALSSLPPSGGADYVRTFVLYILATQEPEAAESFRGVLRQYAPEVGDNLMTYAQQLLAEGREEGREEGRAEGREEGRLEERVRLIAGLLQAGAAWSMIEAASGINEAQFQALKQQLDDLSG